MLVRGFQVGALSEYSVLMLVGALSSLWLYGVLAARAGVGSRAIHLQLLLVPVACAAGVRLLFYAQHNLILGDRTAPLLSGEGTGHFGVLLLGALCVAAVRRLTRADAAATWDAWAVPLCLAIAWGRLACFTAGCCFGTPAELPWSVCYPGAGSPGESPAFRSHLAAGWVDAATATSLSVHPTQLYLALWAAATGLFLWALSRRAGWRGALFPLFLLLHCSGRFLLEHLRGDERGVLGGLHFEHIYSLIGMGVAARWLLAALRAHQSIAIQRETR